MKDGQNRCRLLLVDGDGERRDRLAGLLQNEYQVVSALDGEMALELLTRDRDFAVILLQCTLFEITGFDVLVRLHASRALSALPVVALGRPEEELKALSLGAVAFVPQDKDLQLVRCQVRNLLNLLHGGNDADPLTGALLWTPFLEAAHRMIEGGRDRYAMVFANVDRFKVFNDLFGRASGDAVLRALSSRLEGVGGGAGVVGRVGGDRFALCCRRSDLDLDRLERLGPDLMRQLKLKYGMQVHCGVYEVDDAELPVDEMCDRARIALDTTGQRGGGHVAFYDERLRQNLHWEQEVVGMMQEALESGQFRVYLQPIFSLTANAPISAEALVRWIHPELGVIPPDRFIPIFERNGFISQLDRYVWERVFQYLVEIRKMGYPEFSISANMSRLDIYDEDVCGRITRLAEKYGVDPSVFRIEVTETAYMNDPDRLMEATRQFNAAGFAVLMDDFGSGYSSLNMLMKLPVSTLKLDMGFVRSVGADERTNCVVTSIVRMAKWLEMSVVAEGAETEEQVAYLRSIGCDKVQGYYFSKPLPWEEFTRLLSGFDWRAAKEPPRIFDEEANTQVVWDVVTQYNRVLRGQMDAAALYEQTGSQLENLCVNDAYYRLIESSPAALFRDTQNATAWIRGQDRRRLLDALNAAFDTGLRQELVIGRYMDATRMKRLMVSVCYLGRKDDRRLYLLLFRDISLLQPPSAPAEDAPAPSAGPAASTGCRSCRKVLIVEDNQVNRTVLRKMLSQDYGVLEAVNGQEGLEMLRRNPDVTAVLLDIIMPIMDGFGFLRSKAEDPALADVPVLVLSQAENKGSEVKALDLGASGFVRKPYEPAMLRKLLESLTGGAKED